MTERAYQKQNQKAHETFFFTVDPVVLMDPDLDDGIDVWNGMGVDEKEWDDHHHNRWNRSRKNLVLDWIEKRWKWWRMDGW